MFLLDSLRRAETLGALVALAAATVLPLHATGSEVARHTLSGDRVAIHNLAGDFTVVPSSGTSVVAEITRNGPDADRLQIQAGTLRGANTLRIVYPGNRVVLPGSEREGRGFKGWGNRWQSNFWVRDDGTLDGKRGEGHRVTLTDRGAGIHASADVRILVPRGRTVAIYWGHGAGDVSAVDASVAIDGAGVEVTARDVKGALHVEVGSGAVRVSDATANLSVDTGSGDVTLTNVRADHLSVETGSGEIDARGIAGQVVSLESGSGDIRAEGIRAPQVHVDTGSGNVLIAIDSDVDLLAVDTGSGNVSIQVPGSVGATFQAETGSGQITSELPLTVRKRSSDTLTGTIGDGRGRIALETGSGNISLRRGGR